MEFIHTRWGNRLPLSYDSSSTMTVETGLETYVSAKGWFCQLDSLVNIPQLGFYSERCILKGALSKPNLSKFTSDFMRSVTMSEWVPAHCVYKAILADQTISLISWHGGMLWPLSFWSAVENLVASPSPLSLTLCNSSFIAGGRSEAKLQPFCSVLAPDSET